MADQKLPKKKLPKSEILPEERPKKSTRRKDDPPAGAVVGARPKRNPPFLSGSIALKEPHVPVDIR